MKEAVFVETTAEWRTQSLPLSHLSLELGHLCLEDVEAGAAPLRRHFEEVRYWAEAARATAAGRAVANRPRISTCFMIDDYFARFSSPAELIPVLLDEAKRAGLVIDYLARESACAVADKVALAQVVADRLVESPPFGTLGARPAVARTGWLANGERSPATRIPPAMKSAPPWQPPKETTARRHSVFLDVELWSDDGDSRRTWSCSFLAAVWQLVRLGLLRYLGEPVMVPRPVPASGFPDDWDALPPLVRLNDRADPFAAYRTCSVLPSRFMAVEHAVRVILDQTEVDPGALKQVAERSAHESLSMPDSVADRISYVFYQVP